MVAVNLDGKESSFGFEELFFSRTNSKGIIESGNSVFQRVSKYEWNELLKKPHNVVRHPFMPRGVFDLLWDTILQKKQIGSYVVNKAKDGTYYWVFALVSPIDDGFVSVRHKPSSPIFKIIVKKYEELGDIEYTKKLSPKESHELLLNEIKKLGFESYEQFMTEALTQEFEFRQKKLNLPQIKVIDNLRLALKLGKELQQKCEEIFTNYQSNIFVPLNIEVQAAKIGSAAASLAVISSQYDNIAKDIQTETRKFKEAGAIVQKKIQDCQFVVCNSLLQKEMINFFRNEDKSGPIEKEVEMSHLEYLGRKGMMEARTSLTEIEKEFHVFKEVHENVRKLSMVLEIISISGKIEVAKLDVSSNDMQALLQNLVGFKNSLKAALAEIDIIGRKLLSCTQDMKKELVM